MSDLRLQRLWRTWILDQTEENARPWRRAVSQMFTSPEAQFQNDLREGGKLWRALVWEMEFSRVSVTCQDEGGLVTCRTRFGKPTHVRVWYQTLPMAHVTGDMEDTRISVSPGRAQGLVLESLIDNSPGATVVSSGVATVQPDGIYELGWSRPKSQNEIDPLALAEVEAVAGSTRAGLANLSPWV